MQLSILNSRGRAFGIIAVAASMSLSLSSCTHSKDSAVNADQPQITIGKSIFHFDYQTSLEMTIAKADPRTGDHWSARVQRIHENGLSFLDTDTWIIKAYSEGPELIDRLANPKWILHFLDTLRTLNPTTKLEDSNTTEVKAHSGLTPPRYAIQWKALNAETSKTDSFEIQIGAAIDQERTPYGESYALIPPSTDVYKVNGAAMAMLEYLKDFPTFRLEVLATIAADDVDEIQLSQKGTPPIYAQREGDQWTDAKHHPLKTSISGFLEQLTHFRIARFIDDKSETEKLRRIFPKQNLIKITLKGRSIKAVEFQFAKIDKVVFATETSRAGAVFELHPETWARLRP